MDQNGRKAVQFWLDGKQAFGVEVKILGEETLVSYHGKFFEVFDGAALSNKGFSEATIPEKWLQGDAIAQAGSQATGTTAAPDTAHPARKPIDLFGTKSVATATGTSDEAGAQNSADSRSLATAGEEAGQEQGLKTADDGATLPAVATAPSAQAPETEIASEAGEPEGGKAQETSATVPPGAAPPHTPEAGPQPGEELDKRRKKREPRTKSEPPKTGDTLLESDEREFEYTCPHCGEVHDRIIKPNGEKGQWELAAGKKVETIQEHFFTTCSSCKQTFAVKVVPVTVYVAKVAGF